MIQTAVSALRPGTEHRPLVDVDRDRFFGFVTLSVGLSLVLVSLRLIPESVVSVFPVGAGGWLLVSIGSNLLLHGEPFHSGWTEDGEFGWVSMTILTVATIAIVIAAVYSVVSGFATVG